MPSWIFFNTSPDPDVVLEYADGFSHFKIHFASQLHEAPEQVYFNGEAESVRSLLAKGKGLEICVPQKGKILLQFRRSWLKRRWKVYFNDVKLSGLQVA